MLKLLVTFPAKSAHEIYDFSATADRRILREGGSIAKRKYSEVGDDRSVEADGGGAKRGGGWTGAGMSKHTVYAWKAKCGAMTVGEAQRLRQLEDENGRLKELVADLSLDREMLKAVIAKNGLSS